MSTRYVAPWTDEQVAELRKLTAEGLSAGQIAKNVATMRPGITRSGVIGKQHRLGIGLCSFKVGGMLRLTKAANAKASARLKATPAAVKRTPPTAQPRNRCRDHDHSYERAVKIPAPTAEPTPASTWAPLAGTTPKPLIECTPRDCRWPAGKCDGPYLFCGAAGASLYDGRPYCGAHTAAESARSRKQHGKKPA